LLPAVEKEKNNGFAARCRDAGRFYLARFENNIAKQKENVDTIACLVESSEKGRTE